MGLERYDCCSAQACESLEHQLINILKGRTLGVPVYELLGGKVRNKVQVYAWIGGDRPADVEVAA